MVWGRKEQSCHCCSIIAIILVVLRGSFTSPSLFILNLSPIRFSLFFPAGNKPLCIPPLCKHPLCIPPLPVPSARPSLSHCFFIDSPFHSTIEDWAPDADQVLVGCEPSLIRGLQPGGQTQQAVHKALPPLWSFSSRAWDGGFGHL